MKRPPWQRPAGGLAAVALVGALGACNSHPLVGSGEPQVVVVNPPLSVPLDGAAPDTQPEPDTQPPPPDANAADAGSDSPPPDADAADAGSDRPDVADGTIDRYDAGVDQAPEVGADGGLELVAWIQSVGGTPVRVLKQNQYVFLGDWENGVAPATSARSQDGSVQTYEVGDPRAPVLRSTLFTPAHQVHDLAINGQWLYVANDLLGLRLVDISQPAALRSVSNRVNGNLYATSVAVTVRGTDASRQLYALVGYLYDGGLDIHAVPDGGPIPDPVHYTSASLSSRCDVNQVQVRDDHAYILASNGETQGYLEILDISRLPTAPPALGRLSLPFASHGGVGDIRLSGDLLYLSTGDYSNPAATHVGGLRIINVRDPTQPALVGSLDLPPSAGSIPWKGTGLALGAKEVFFITSSGVQVLDVSTPSAPARRTFASFPTAFGVCQGGTAVWEADLLYVGAYCRPPTGQGGLAIYRRY
jgi:hypothetical protein